jgi:hypothetical protein
VTQKHEPEQTSPTNWTELMAHYGQAMIQVGKLEQEIALLKQIPVHNAPFLDASEQITQHEFEATRQQETIKSLMLQINDLQFQLFQVEQTTDTKDGTGRASRNQNRKHRRHWWQLWRPRRHARTRQAE